MNNLLNWIEANIGKILGVPFSVSSIQFIMTLMHMISEGTVSHEELEALLQAGSASNMVMLALALAYMKFKKK